MAYTGCAPLFGKGKKVYCLDVVREPFTREAKKGVSADPKVPCTSRLHTSAVEIACMNEFERQIWGTQQQTCRFHLSVLTAHQVFCLWQQNCSSSIFYSDLDTCMFGTHCAGFRQPSALETFIDALRRREVCRACGGRSPYLSGWIYKLLV